jgi:hypothetical protein
VKNNFASLHGSSVPVDHARWRDPKLVLSYHREQAFADLWLATQGKAADSPD